MRFRYPILILLVFSTFYFLLFSKSAFPMETIIGEIVEIDSENSQIKIRPIVLRPDSDEQDNEENQNIETITVPRDVLKTVAIGRKIRLYGDYVNLKEKKFQALNIGPKTFDRHDNDPTGVRLRLKMKENRHHNPRTLMKGHGPR